MFARTAREHEQRKSEDDGLSKLEAQQRARKAGIKTDPTDGMTVLWGRFDPITGTRIKNMLTAKTNQLWREEDPKERPTTEQRMADALAELLCQPGSDENGKKPKTDLLLIAHYDTGEQRIRDATLADGDSCTGRPVPGHGLPGEGGSRHLRHEGPAIVDWPWAGGWPIGLSVWH